jgi:hypothetical protein
MAEAFCGCTDVVALCVNAGVFSSLTNQEGELTLFFFLQQVVYSLKQIFHDLLRFSAHHLKLGGRLVFWIPIIRYIIRILVEVNA